MSTLKEVAAPFRCMRLTITTEVDQCAGKEQSLTNGLQEAEVLALSVMSMLLTLLQEVHNVHLSLSLACWHKLPNSTRLTSQSLVTLSVTWTHRRIRATAPQSRDNQISFIYICVLRCSLISNITSFKRLRITLTPTHVQCTNHLTAP